MKTRPTQALVKEALFNILGERIRGKNLLDLYAGKGGVGLYALKKGAESVTFIESDISNVKEIRRRLRESGGKGRVYHGDVMKILKRIRLDFGVIFLDPPYNKGFVLPTLRVIESKRPPLHTLVIVEHHQKEEVKERFDLLRPIKTRSYGETSLTIYEVC